MYLKTLSMRGFKSFADKTAIELDPLGGITAVVGPNGCGKSNLVDAVRWVLGEQNPKELRSSALEEVIFAGSASRKPLSLAEVTLTLDNSDNKVKSEFSEISIKRRTYRSGESEFQINKAACRLKDIKDLFLDTGLGSGSYSIINQGQVDEILSSKPEDRRKVFEEAARINKYKFRKKAAERKLISTEQNLLRISDLKSEITNQLSTLSSQAEKAKQFNQLRDSLKNLEIGASKRQLKNFSDRKDNINAQITALKNQSGQSFDVAKELEAEKNRNKTRLVETEREIENFRLEIGQAKLTYEESKSGILLNKEKARHLEEKLATVKHELKTLLPQLEALNATLTAKKKDEKTSKENLLAAEIDLNNIESEVKKINDGQSGLVEEIEKIKTEIFDKETLLTEEKNHLRDLESNIKFVKEESRRDKELSRELEEESKVLSTEKNSIVLNITGTQESINKNEKKITLLSRSLKDKQEELKDLQGQFVKKKESLDSKSSKYDLLLEFQKTNEYYPKGVKEALRAGEKKLFGKVYGIVGEQIKVGPEHETAISSALSSSIMHIIVDNDETTQEIIRYLKDNNLGRATFLPINLIENIEAGPRLPKHKGIIDFASKLIQTDEKFSKVMEYLLGKTIVIDNLKNAIDLAKKKIPFKIVTLEGEFIPDYGTISGGSSKKTGAGLGREREILALEEELKTIKAQLEQINKTKETALSDISTKEQELKYLSETNSKLNIELVRSEQTCKGVEEKLHSAREELGMIQSSVKARNDETGEIGSRKQEINSRISELELRLKELGDTFKTKQENIKAGTSGKEEINTKLTDSKILHSNAQTSLKHVSEEIIRIESNIKNLESLTVSKNENNVQEELEQIRKNIAKLENSLPRLQNKEKELSQNLEKLQIEKGVIQKEIETQEEKLKSETGRELNIKDALSKEEISLARIESELEVIAQRMAEEYGLTLEQIINAESEVTNVSQTKDEINNLKQRIGELGPVNLLAIEEFEKAKERISFIENQYNDLMIARENLGNLIRELDSKAKIEFLNTIKIVNEHFSNIFATLFEGGEAKITLSGDENILESGIDIIAKPGGKKWLSLSIMSGGERALTAIALLFALLRTHPSPFCFLDEVDAALDEANVHRFARMLKDFSKSTQIILITHNKQTMAIADTLYGITMGDPGISKVISVKFSKVAT
ncbi:chromosome segregation protein SMC [Candidatus Margulisiibacteriota bacterium]